MTGLVDVVSTRAQGHSFGGSGGRLLKLVVLQMKEPFKEDEVPRLHAGH